MDKPRTLILTETVVRVLDLDVTPPREVWRGSLLRYVTVNGIAGEDLHDLAHQLIAQGFHITGGGAAPTFAVEPVPANEIRVVFAGSPRPFEASEKRRLLDAMLEMPRVASCFKRMTHSLIERAAA